MCKILFVNKVFVLALAFVLSGMSATLQAQNADAVLKQAESMLRAQDYSGAIALLEKNIKVFDTEGVRAVTAWGFLGLAYFSTGNYGKSEDYYKKSEDYLRPLIERNLQYVVAYKEILSRLTRVYIELSDYRNVICYSKMKIEIMERYKEYGENYETGLADAYATLSHFYLYTREYAQAEEAAMKALEINCMDGWAMCYFAYSSFFQRKMQEAEAMHTALLSPVGYNNDGVYDPYILDNYLKSLEENGAVPDSAKDDVEQMKIKAGVLKQAHSMSKAGNHSGAAALLETNIRLFETEGIKSAVMVWGCLGDYYKKSGQYDKASAYYEKYLDCFSSHTGQYFRIHFFPYMRSLSVMARFQFYELSNPEGARKYCQNRISCIEEYRKFFDERKIEMPHSISTGLEKYQRKAETDMMEYSK